MEFCLGIERVDYLLRGVVCESFSTVVAPQLVKKQNRLFATGKVVERQNPSPGLLIGLLFTKG